MEIQKTHYTKLVTHVEAHASAVSLLESGEQCYIKATNNNSNNKASWQNESEEMMEQTRYSRTEGKTVCTLMFVFSCHSLTPSLHVVFFCCVSNTETES